MARNLVLAALRDAWLALEPLQAPMAVMGGIALAAWERVRATQDVDLLIGVADADVNNLLSRLEAAGFRAKRDPVVMDLAGLRIIQMLYQPPGAFVELQVGLLLAASAYHRVALTRRLATRLPELDIEVFVLTCEDLILHKLLAGRIVDRADCAALILANRATLDRNYLLHWSNQLGLGLKLSEVWDETFPGEPLVPAGDE